MATRVYQTVSPFLIAAVTALIVFPLSHIVHTFLGGFVDIQAAYTAIAVICDVSLLVVAIFLYYRYYWSGCDAIGESEGS